MLYTHSPVYELADFSINKEKGSICVVQFNQLTFILIMMAHCERGKSAMRRVPFDRRCFSAAQRRRQGTERRSPSRHGVQLWHFSSRDTDEAFFDIILWKVSDEMHFSLAANNNSSLSNRLLIGVFDKYLLFEAEGGSSLRAVRMLSKFAYLLGSSQSIDAHRPYHLMDIDLDQFI